MKVVQVKLPFFCVFEEVASMYPLVPSLPSAMLYPTCHGDIISVQT